MFRRINIFAGPGAGKSVLAIWLCAELKIAGFSIEYISERAKKWAYSGKPISSFDEVYLFGKQMHEEDSLLKSGVGLTISDSPILIIGAYATRNNDVFASELISLANKFEKIYPSINIMLDRADMPYKEQGRYESYKEAKYTDRIIEQVLGTSGVDFEVFRPKDREKVLSFIVEKLNGT